MSRISALFLGLLILMQPHFAAAQVMLSFHSFNGSMFGGRYPHTFIVLEGTLEAGGAAVHENYGYSAISASPAVLAGPVKGRIVIEKPIYLTTTNRHFTVPISDAKYREIVAEVHAWRDEPGKGYRLDHRNCVHFVSRIATMVGLNAEVPQRLVRKPRAWLNLVGRLNPQLNAREFN